MKTRRRKKAFVHRAPPTTTKTPHPIIPSQLYVSDTPILHQRGRGTLLRLAWAGTLTVPEVP